MQLIFTFLKMFVITKSYVSMYFFLPSVRVDPVTAPSK